MKRKGIILAGGNGTRLYPVTQVGSKQLLPVYDKPMVYYPLSTLMLGGIRDYLIITSAQDAPRFKELLQDGRQWGIDIRYAVQPEPKGIAQGLTIAEPFLDGAPSCLVLGDNLFYGHDLPRLLTEAGEQKRGATVFAYQVRDPARYGVIELDAAGRPVSIEEKPERPRSRFAVTGLYFYDGEAPSIARRLRPSARGEFEITDLNRAYLDAGRLSVSVLGRGHAWLDTGTHDSLIEASIYVQTIERRQGLKICCPEEIAYRMGYIDAEALRSLALPLQSSGYGQYLLDLIGEPGPGPRQPR